MPEVCCFTGHREIKKDISEVRRLTEEVVEDLIEEGVFYYYAGGAIGFDTIAAQTVIKLKAKCPQVKLCLALPCLPSEQTRMWTAEQKDAYMDILAQSDKIVLVDKFFTHQCMLNRDRYMVDHSSICVAYKEELRFTGGTAYTLDYAKKKGLKIYNLTDL